MSRDSKHGKDDRRRRRNDDEPSWYDKAVNTEYQEEVMTIPKGKAGLIIGKKGWRIKDIKEQSGVKELNIRDDQVHIRGTEEQCSNAKKIIDVILKVLVESPFSVFIWKHVPLTGLQISSPPSSVIDPLSLHFFFLPRSFLPSLTSLLAYLSASFHSPPSSSSPSFVTSSLLPPPFLYPLTLPSFLSLCWERCNKSAV